MKFSRNPFRSDHGQDVHAASPSLPIIKLIIFIVQYIVAIILPLIFLLCLVFRRTPVTFENISNTIADNPRDTLAVVTAISSVLAWLASQLFSTTVGWFAEVRSSEGIDTETLLLLVSLKSRSAEPVSALATNGRLKHTLMTWVSVATFALLSAGYTNLLTPTPVTLRSVAQGWEPDFLSQDEECINYFRDHYINIANSTCGWQVRTQ